MALWVDDFPFPVWWDMLVSWRVSQVVQNSFLLGDSKKHIPSFSSIIKRSDQPWRFTKQLCTESFWNRTKPGKAGWSRVESGSGRSFINKIQVCHLASDLNSLNILWISQLLVFFPFFCGLLLSWSGGLRRTYTSNIYIYIYMYTCIYILNELWLTAFADLTHCIDKHSNLSA